MTHDISELIGRTIALLRFNELRTVAARLSGKLHLSRLREPAARVLMLLAVVILLAIAGASGFVMNTARTEFLSAIGVRSDIFSKGAASAMFPETNIFEVHFLVNTLMLDRQVSYAYIMRQNGTIISHSNPEKITTVDISSHSAVARNSATHLMQKIRGDGGGDYYYFSNPILVGKKRLGTSIVAISEAKLDEALSPLRERLTIVFLGSLCAIPLLWQLLLLFRGEKKAAALKSAMMHTVSHEFNNAITVLDASVFMLKESDQAKPDKDRKELYDTLQFEIRSLSRYVKNILNEARMDSGRMKLYRKNLALRDLVNRIINSMRPLIRQRRLDLAMEVPELPVEVIADREAMSLIVSNLIGNAIKYTPEGGSITVRLLPEHRSPGLLTFCVTNSGAGIQPDDIAKIKQEFYRTEDAKAAASGFGLGLRISNELLLLHGSELHIESIPGKGTTFGFSLPMHSAEKPSAIT